MRFAVALFLLLHGIAHLPGFFGAWGKVGAPPDLSSTPLGHLFEEGSMGAKAIGIVWLMLCFSYAAVAALVVLRQPLAIPAALGVAVVSLLLSAMTWPVVKVGVIANLAVIAVALLAARQTSMYLENSFANAFESAAPRPGDAAGPPVTEQQLAPLPEPVRRYLHFMGVVGRPRDWSLRAHFDARFRRDAGAWLPCEALQYDTRLGVARYFYMRLVMKAIVPVIVRDTYVNGRGRMLARAFDALTVVDGTGMELDTGELVTYLNDATLMAPSLVLGPETAWSAVEGDPNAFDVAFTDGGRTVRARVFIDDRGAPTNFRTTDRFFDYPDGRRARTEWNTPIEGWQLVSGRRLPTRGQAVWMLPGGPFAYGDFPFDAGKIEFNVLPAR